MTIKTAVTKIVVRVLEAAISPSQIKHNSNAVD